MSALETLILGLGNPLLGDEGVGVHAARALAGADLPAGTEVLEIGTAVLEALPDLERARRVIVVDAMKGGETPGTIYRLPLEDCRHKEQIASMHGFDLPRVLALSRRADLPEVIVIGVEPASFDWSLELSPTLAQALPELVEIVLREVAEGCAAA